MLHLYNTRRAQGLRAAEAARTKETGSGGPGA